MEFMLPQNQYESNYAIKQWAYIFPVKRQLKLIIYDRWKSVAVHERQAL